MKPETHSPNGVTTQLVQVRPEPPGQFTAQVVGLPELRAMATSRVDAIQQVRAMFQEWLLSGQLVVIETPRPNPLMEWCGRADPNDPEEQLFLAELARFRQEDLERTLREYDQKCSSSSSTPTT